MMTQILRGTAQIVDALNPVRNDKSLAHPNVLLDEPEAMLAIKAIRTTHCYSFSSVASTLAVAAAPTVNVLSHVLKPDFPSLILWSPTASRIDEGVLPMNLSSTVISAPSGVDLMSTVESVASKPFPFCVEGASTVG